MLYFSRSVEVYLAFLLFDIEYDEFFITVFKNVVVCMVKYYLMKVFLRSTRMYGIVCQCDKLPFSLSNLGMSSVTVFQ